MFNGLKKIRLRFKFLIAVSLIIFSLLLYIFSYGIILPLTEGSTSFYIANIIYTPVEKLRLKNTTVYNLTEAIYSCFKGEVEPEDRFASEGALRRRIIYDENGIMRGDSIFKNGDYISGTSYYPNGKKQMRIIDSSIESIESSSETWYENGQRESYATYPDSGEGYIEHYDKNGNILTKCTKRKWRPWSGSLIIEEKGEKRIVYYSDGKPVDAEGKDIKD